MAVDFAAIFSAKDKVSKTLNKINKSGTNLSSTFGKIAKVAAGAFSVAKIAQFGKESIDTFTTFENGMNEVFTLLPDMSGDAMGQMTQQVKDFAKEQGVLTTEAVPALYQALSAGVPKDTVFDFMKSANKAAIGGVTTLETAVDGLSSVVNSYGSDVISVDKASDLMFTTVRLGKTTFEELSDSLFNVNPTAAAAGVSFDQVSAALAAMTAQGVPTSVATTQLRQAFVELSKSGTTTDKTFRQIAGKGFKDFLAEGNNVQDAFKLLEDYANKTGVGVNDLFGSVEAGNAVLALTGTNSDRFASALDEMAKAAGATDKAYETMEQGFKRKLDKMKANIEVLKIDVGDKLVGAFNAVWDVASPIVEKLKGGFEKIGSKVKNLYKGIKNIFTGKEENAIDILGMLGIDDNSKRTILTYARNMSAEFGKAFDNIKTVFGGIGKILTGDMSGGADIMKLLGMDDKQIRTAMIKFNNMFDNAKGKIADFVKAIIPTITSMKEMFSPLVKSLGKTFATIMSAIVPLVTYISQKLKPIFESVFKFIVERVLPPVITFFSENMPKIANIFKNLCTLLTPIIGAIIDVIGRLWEQSKPIISGVISLITGLGSSLFSILDGIIRFITGVFTGDWKGAWEGIVEIFDGIISGIGTLIKAPLNYIIDKINAFTSGLGEISIPDWVPGIGGNTYSIPQIPLLARGSLDSPDTFIAGEKGPELITNMGGSRVFPSKDTGEILSAFNNVVHNISDVDNPYSSVSRTESVSEKTFNININGTGGIKANGLTKDEVLKVLIENIKPVLLKIIETEKYEEGDLSFDF